MADGPTDEGIELDPGAPRPGSLGALRRRGIYLLPNLFTTGVLFCGFYAIVQAMTGHFEISCIAVYVAMVLDGMDGRVARWTNTQSEFGAQYDSIADMVAFGAAPALVAYTWVLKDLGTAGWIGAFIYCAGAGIRLARFNANIGVVDKHWFQGLPSPSGAAVLTGLIWMLTSFGLTPDAWYVIAAITWLTAVFIGATMVSNVPFYSFKVVNWRQRVPLWVILAAVLGFAIVASRPSLVLFAMFFGYALSGYVAWTMGKRPFKTVLPEE